MNIEIAEPGRMTQSGRSLLKLIQNNNMPILDLLVRESIQNSLDAGNVKSEYVAVDFNIGEFEKEKLNAELEGITNSLNNKYCKNKYNYIAIRDSNTTGLTGKLHYDDVVDNQYGNLLKLIYEISKPQEAEGAGGSWGLGKTVYFRIGIGLVIYYSRIINEDGDFESRLAASLVEDETNKDSLIPIFNGKAKRGIAWWGESIGINKTRPIINNIYINKILSIFNIDPYTDNETGTTIIIPYIDEDLLVENNQIEYKDGEENNIPLFWRNNIEDYIRISIQRWYAPRLNNKKYPYGKFLRVKINGKGIGLDTMEPAFQIVQALYNIAVTNKNSNDILENKDIIKKSEDILLRKVLKTTKAGTIAYAKVPRQVLKTGYPNNKPEPYMYFNCEIRDKEKNKPILFFTRKPGMIVSYEVVGSWVDGINSSNKDEFIFAIFVLNSNNKLTGIASDYSLEEYIRKSEMADHTSWRDFGIGNFNSRIISKIHTQVNGKISKEFFIEEEEENSKLNSGFGKMFGQLLLPPENFGKKPSSGTRKNYIDIKHLEKHKNVIFIYDCSRTSYTHEGMKVNFQIKSRGSIISTGIKVAINSESGAISVFDWENKMGLDIPFEITIADIIITKFDGQIINSIYSIDKAKPNIIDNQLTFKLIMSDKKSGYGVHISMEQEHEIECDIALTLKLNRKDIKPMFVLEKEGDK